MKWDSLNWAQQKRLMELYDQQRGGDVPEAPEFTAPLESRRAVVPADGSDDIYVRMVTRRQASLRGESDAQGELRLVGASEHIRVPLPDVGIIRALINELERLASDIKTYNAEIRAHLERARQHDEANEAYKKAREKALREGLASGKYTADDIAAWEDIPF